MDWKAHAERLAETVTHPTSRWRPIIAGVPRHEFVPRWWTWREPAAGPYGAAVWDLADRKADPAAWLEAAYTDRSRVTRVGTDHADSARPGSTVAGSPTSSATLPSLIVQMAQHALLTEGLDVLDVGTGSGYGAALLAARQGDAHVTSVDVDPYLVSAAAARLDRAGLRPELRVVDATGPLEGSWDRIIATVAVRPVPASWLAALRPGGRLVTTLAGTSLILTADAAPGGGAEGRIEWQRAGFMEARHGGDYPPEIAAAIEAAHSAPGEDNGPGRFPVINVQESWEVWSMLGVTAPGVHCDYEETEDGWRRAVLVHGDGSWARAVGDASGTPRVHQGGPRRLWDVLEDIRARWLRDGSLPIYGARAVIDPDGTIHLQRGRWSATIRE
ncbi:methyltransferase domain-containing protein [Actinomadura viridis]|uniref:methyltransferase domain-containing protein n=1 Tax=Actinomadura viridis TaxID=58110 RepID=UPI0036A0AC18